MDLSKYTEGQSPASRKINILGLTLCIVPCVYVVLFILHVALHPNQNLWDFQRDYYSVKAILLGLNPYDHKVIETLAGLKQSYPFVYSPLSLLFFAPFALLSYETAQLAALGFYIFILLGTFAVFSQRILPNDKFKPLFFFFAVLAFNGAINKSIQTGNVASLETALVFMALLCWLKGRHIWFMILIFAASVFKFTPLFFLGLIFFEKPPRWRSTAISLLAFIVLVAISLQVVFSVFSISFSEWLDMERMGISWCTNNLAFSFDNPSMFCFLTDLISNCNSVSIQNPAIATIFVLWVATLLFFTIRAGLYLARDNHDEARTDLVVLVLLCYALVLPRFQDYSWVLLIPAVFRVLMAREYAMTAGPLMILCLIPHRLDSFPGLMYFFNLIMIYTPTIVVFGAWLLLILNVMERAKSNKSTISNSPDPTVKKPEKQKGSHYMQSKVR
ncbi:MAG: glycosyltransferase family 87 protein [Smithella sp.]